MYSLVKSSRVVYFDRGHAGSRLRGSPDNAQVMEDARSKAAKIIEEARIKAEEILRDAENRALQILDETKEKAFRRGYEEGRNEALSKMEASVRQAEESVLKAQAEAERIAKEALEAKAMTIREAEPEIVRLVMDVGQKVIRREISTNPNIVVDMVRQSITHINQEDEVTVRVNPTDVARVMEREQFILSGVKTPPKMNVIEDPSVEQGGCLVETASGRIDARIDSQLGKVAQGFDEVLRGED